MNEKSQNHFRLLFLGDIFGEPGRRAAKHFVPELKERYNLDLVLANCENAANGRGVSKRIAHQLFESGIDFMTSGNHIYHVHDSWPFLDEQDCKILRPYNYASSSPGKGVGVVEAKNGVKVGVINLMGRVFMEPGVNLPFQSFDEALMEIQSEADLIVLDFHAETTAEKRAMGWHVDGRIQLFVGTHTHVQTADEEILPNGTAYITDLGMCGPYDSVIGMDKNIVLKRFRNQLSGRFEVASGDVRLCGIVCDIDLNTKKAIHIERVCEKLM